MIPVDNQTIAFYFLTADTGWMIERQSDSGLILLGPVDGFYPVEGIEKPEPQLWIPNTLQDFEARCLAMQLRDDGVDPDIVISISRGGNIVGQAIAYSNNIKPLISIQTTGWTNDTTQDEETIILNFPHITDDMKQKKILIADELADSAQAIRLVYGWAKENLDPTEITTAVIYLKDRERVMTPDHYWRIVRNLWLDHESQSSHERRAQRILELLGYGWGPHIEEAMGRLALTPVDLDLIKTSIEASAFNPVFDFSRIPGHSKLLGA